MTAESLTRGPGRPGSPVVRTLCRSQEPWGCLGFTLLMLAAVPLAGTLVAWVLLRVAGVRPAWRVAALGPVLPGGRGITDRAERELVASKVPLLAPDLHGYRMYFPEASEYSGTFGYLLLPRPVETSAADREQRGVRVTVSPQVSGFAPPDVCEVESGGSRVDAGPCEQVAPDTWRSTRGGSIRYIARREGVIVVLTGGGPSVPDGDLRAMADSLAVRRPAFFLDPNGR
ncbi:hypothetical protein [Streptomyces sp. NPDC090131]|uniref:hypothetical protein n=1 Tax=Streptomyces sp. NPDC090131 TaxID=3365954 RepID=UPI003818111A